MDDPQEYKTVVAIYRALSQNIKNQAWDEGRWVEPSLDAEFKEVPTGPQASHSLTGPSRPTKNSVKYITTLLASLPLTQEAYRGRCYYHSYFADEETGIRGEVTLPEW